MKTLKSEAQKLLIIGPNLFFHNPAQLTTHSPELIFQYYKYMSQDTSVSLSVMFSMLCKSLPLSFYLVERSYSWFGKIKKKKIM